MIKFGAQNFRVNLTKICKAVQKSGKHAGLTKSGRLIAILIPIEDYELLIREYPETRNKRKRKKKL